MLVGDEAADSLDYHRFFPICGGLDRARHSRRGRRVDGVRRDGRDPGTGERGGTPASKLLSCPLIIVTLGLFVLVINGITLWLASALAVSWFHVGFYVDGYWAAFLGALIVSIVSVVLTSLVREETRGPS